MGRARRLRMRVDRLVLGRRTRRACSIGGEGACSEILALAARAACFAARALKPV